ncbi:MAG: MinD/ParA family protein [Pseudobdellovibrionaceae bacterium]|jgi:flagellar biosynthesis protein FlhG
MSARFLSQKTRTIAITSGKGGVGKTTLTSNMAQALAQQGQRVLIFDGDLGMANIDIMFGVKPEGNILDVIRGEKEISEVVTQISPLISLISGGSGIVELNRLNPFERRALVDSVSQLEHAYDYMLIDTAPGISDNVLYLNAAAQMSAVIINPDPASLADSYALIKVLNREHRETRFSIICNQVRDEVEGLSLFNRFSEVVNRFLSIGLDYWGSVPQDNLLKRSTLQQRLIVRHEPQAESARAIQAISLRMQQSVQKSDTKAGLQFFWEQVVGVA